MPTWEDRWNSRRDISAGEKRSSIIANSRFTHRVDVVENTRGRHHPAGVQVAAVVLNVVANDLALTFMTRAPR